MARIAFIGLGNMGGGMAANLVKAGHEVRAFDLSEAALEEAAAQLEAKARAELEKQGIGAGEARLTPIDLTQAFGRLVSDRTLVLRFIPADSAGSPWPNHGLRSQRWYPTFMAGLRGVGETGTAAGTGAIVRRVLGTNVAFFGKTGTLNAPASSLRRAPDTIVTVDPVVATTLVFAVGTAPRNGNAALSCGFVGTIYFRLNREVERVEPLATAFANQKVWPVLRRHWSRLAVCPAADRRRRRRALPGGGRAGLAVEAEPVPQLGEPGATAPAGPARAGASRGRAAADGAATIDAPGRDEAG